MVGVSLPLFTLHIRSYPGTNGLFPPIKDLLHYRSNGVEIITIWIKSDDTNVCMHVCVRETDNLLSASTLEVAALVSPCGVSFSLLYLYPSPPLPPSPLSLFV